MMEVFVPFTTPKPINEQAIVSLLPNKEEINVASFKKEKKIVLTKKGTPSRHGKHREGYIRPDRLNLEKRKKRLEQTRKANAKYYLKKKSSKPMSFGELSEIKKRNTRKF